MLIKASSIKNLALILLIILIAALFIGGHQPASGHLFVAPWDKAVHFAFYGILTLLISLAFPSLSLVIVFMISMSLGCLDEFHQIFVPNRHPGIDDLVADLAGVLVAVFLVPILRKFIKKISISS